MGFTIAEANAIKDWYCLECQQNKGLKITYRHNQVVDGPIQDQGSNTSNQSLIVAIPEINSGDVSGLSPRSSPLPTVSNDQAGPSNAPALGEQGSEAPNNEPEVPRINEDDSDEDGSDEADSDEEYDVKDILEVRRGKTSDEYLVQWDDDTTSWESQSCIGMGCIDLVKAVRAKFGFPVIPFANTFGASGKGKFNPANWRSFSDVIQGVDKWDRLSDDRLPVEVFQDGLKDTVITLLGFKRHIFVIYKSSFSGVTYLADGSNFFLDDKEVQTAVSNQLGLFPTGIKFVGQVGIDHCTSSAVMIALSYRTAYRAKREPLPIKAERDRLERIKSAFHPEPSVTVPAAGPLRNLEPDICPYCNKQFNYRNRQKYFGHIRGHENKGRKSQ